MRPHCSVGVTGSQNGTAHASLGMRRLEIIQSSTLEEDDGDENIIDEFLSSFGTLQSLVIYAPQTHALRPSLESIAKHGHSLRTLYLEFELHREPWCYALPDLGDCLSQCQGIEQLALNFKFAEYDPDYGFNDDFDDTSLSNFS